MGLGRVTGKHVETSLDDKNGQYIAYGGGFKGEVCF